MAFDLPGLEAHGLAKILSNRYAIMVRSGYHCAQPLHEELGIPQTVRASFYLYNTVEEVRSLAAALTEIARSYIRASPPIGFGYPGNSQLPAEVKRECPLLYKFLNPDIEIFWFK